MITWPAKDPQEIKDYTLNLILDTGDTIASATAVMASGSVVIDSHTVGDSSIVVWLSGGSNGETCLVRFTATTTGGRTFEELATFQVHEATNALLAQFRLRCPLFADVADSPIEYWLADASTNLGTDYGAHQDIANILWAAHYLTINGYGSGSEAQRIAKFGGATRVKSGSLELAWDAGSGDGLSSTSYGKQLLTLARIYKGGPRITDTGTTCFTPAGYPYGIA